MKQTKKKTTKPIDMVPASEVTKAMGELPIHCDDARVDSAYAILRNAVEHARIVPLMTTDAEVRTDEEVRAMSQLAEEVIGTQIAQLAGEIIAAANGSVGACGRCAGVGRLPYGGKCETCGGSGSASASWERADLSIDLRLHAMPVWVVGLGRARSEAPSVIEALRGLLAIVKRFRATTERAV